MTVTAPVSATAQNSAAASSRRLHTDIMEEKGEGEASRLGGEGRTMSSADQVLSRCSDVPDVIGCTERELIPALLTALLARRRTQKFELHSCFQTMLHHTLHPSGR